MIEVDCENGELREVVGGFGCEDESSDLMVIE